MKAYLSPCSKSNCQNLSPGSPSNKYFCSPSLSDSCGSLDYSQMIRSQAQGTKFHSFKKIKEQRIKQKNQQGRIVKQMIYKAKEKRQRLKTLDDVKTIVSHNSPRSSVSTGKMKVQESIIIMRGKDMENMNEKDEQDLGVQTQPQTPCFKRRNTFAEEKTKKTDFLKPILVNPCTLRSIETGMIFHYQITKMPVQAYSSIMQIRHEGVLQIYQVIALKSCHSHLSLVLYEPYSESLSQKILKSPQISLKYLLSQMIQLIKILSHLRNLCIYPEIQPTTVLLSHSSLKIKLRCTNQNIQMSQRQCLRQFGFYFSSLLRNVCGRRKTGVHGTPGSRLEGRVVGMTIGKRLEFENLMEQFIRYQQYSYDQAYLKLQAFQI